MKEKIGLYIGRFQPFHKGHLSVVKEAMKQCDTLVIAVGSAQESRTQKNPFTFCERKAMIEKSCQIGSIILSGKKVVIVPVRDREEYSDDSNWGQYVLDCVEKECGLRPTINFEGGEECRSTWFDGIDIERVVIDRTNLPISATMVRQALIDDRYEDYCSMVPAAMWLWYGILSKIIILEVEQ